MNDERAGGWVDCSIHLIGFSVGENDYYFCTLLDHFPCVNAFLAAKRAPGAEALQVILGLVTACAPAGGSCLMIEDGGSQWMLEEGNCIKLSAVSELLALRMMYTQRVGRPAVVVDLDFIWPAGVGWGQ